MSKDFHIPGLPKSPEPPNLGKLVSSLRDLNHPEINKVGLTTTEKGDWALLVGVKNGAQTPLKEVEDKCIDFPIIYQEDKGNMSVARPAYPELGE